MDFFKSEFLSKYYSYCDFSKLKSFYTDNDFSYNLRNFLLFRFADNFIYSNKPLFKEYLDWKFYSQVLSDLEQDYKFFYWFYLSSITRDYEL